MEILVLIKNALDPSRLKIKDDSVLIDDTPRITSDIDKNALEAALQMKSKCGGIVKVLSVGDSLAKDSLVEALAMGADEAVLVNTRGKNLSGLEKAKIISKVIKSLSWNPDIILLGEASVDNFSSQTGPRISVELGIPYISYITEINCNKNDEGYWLKVKKSLEGFMFDLRVRTPIILSVTREINRPRYVPFSRILRFSRLASKLIKEIDIEELSLKASRSIEVIELKPFRVSRKRVIFTDPPEIAVGKLIKALEEEGILK